MRLLAPGRCLSAAGSAPAPVLCEGTALGLRRILRPGDGTNARACRCVHHEHIDKAAKLITMGVVDSPGGLARALLGARVRSSEGFAGRARQGPRAEPLQVRGACDARATQGVAVGFEKKVSCTSDSMIECANGLDHQTADPGRNTLFGRLRSPEPELLLPSLRADAAPSSSHLQPRVEASSFRERRRNLSATLSGSVAVPCLVSLATPGAAVPRAAALFDYGQVPIRADGARALVVRSLTPEVHLTELERLLVQCGEVACICMLLDMAGRKLRRAPCAFQATSGAESAVRRASLRGEGGWAAEAHCRRPVTLGRAGGERDRRSGKGEGAKAQQCPRCSRVVRWSTGEWRVRRPRVELLGKALCVGSAPAAGYVRWRCKRYHRDICERCYHLRLCGELVVAEQGEASARSGASLREASELARSQSAAAEDDWSKDAEKDASGARVGRCFLSGAVRVWLPRRSIAGGRQLADLDGLELPFEGLFGSEQKKAAELPHKQPDIDRNTRLLALPRQEGGRADDEGHGGWASSGLGPVGGAPAPPVAEALDRELDAYFGKVEAEENGQSKKAFAELAPGGPAAQPREAPAPEPARAELPAPAEAGSQDAPLAPARCEATAPAAEEAPPPEAPAAAAEEEAQPDAAPAAPTGEAEPAEARPPAVEAAPEEAPAAVAEKARPEAASAAPAAEAEHAEADGEEESWGSWGASGKRPAAEADGEEESWGRWGATGTWPEEVPKARLQYREVDFSCNQLSALFARLAFDHEASEQKVLDLCGRCDGLQIVKLFRSVNATNKLCFWALANSIAARLDDTMDDSDCDGESPAGKKERPLGVLSPRTVEGRSETLRDASLEALWKLSSLPLAPTMAGPAALKLLGDMWKTNLTPSIVIAFSYNAGISSCQKGEQWQRALALLSELREARLEPNVISTALGSARARRASSGSRVWRCSARRGRRSWSPTSFSYNAGISACEKGEQWQRALALLSEMREVNLELDVISTALASARARKASSGRGLWRC
ncbi:unnamed protein product [Prorocentrum cordatum]|uniref:Pentatricopeptide repeat-containing protein, chloroplastic n=1 Tax=Prorocentrum cordatum TaxID=2364126 RepID=A0ABN9PUY6_9DINO|nr:unnamed protein product [Polarella glacialis]